MAPESERLQPGKEPNMAIARSLLSLRVLLVIDAVTCAVMGVILAAGSAAIAPLTELPAALLLYVGLGLLPIAAVMAAVAWRPAVNLTAARLLIAGNVAWIAASLLLLSAAWIEPNALGTAFVIVQAAMVAFLVKLELSALARIVPTPSARHAVETGRVS